VSALRGLALCCGVLLPALSAADEAATLAQCAAVEDATVRLACYDALARRPAAAAAPVVLPPPVVPPVPAADAFGKPQENPSIEARIVGSFITWKRGTLVRLDNGQVWKVMDESGEYYPDLEENPEVTITRGLTGYRMTIKALRKKVGVKRVS
jgi:hypothetical protein